jgi:hypothetical protein
MCHNYHGPCHCGPGSLSSLKKQVILGTKKGKFSVRRADAIRLLLQTMKRLLLARLLQYKTRLHHRKVPTLSCYLPNSFNPVGPAYLIIGIPTVSRTGHSLQFPSLHKLVFLFLFFLAVDYLNPTLDALASQMSRDPTDPMYKQVQQVHCPI